MKKIFTLACAIIMAATASQAKDIETENFDKVNVNVAARVRIVEGDTYSVNINSAAEWITENIKVTMKDGVLSIGTGNVNAEELADSRIMITITAPADFDLSTDKQHQAEEIDKSQKG